MYVIIHKNRVIAGILPWNAQYFTDVLRTRHRILTELPRNEPEASAFPWEINADTKIIPAQEDRQQSINPLIEYYYGPTWDLTDTSAMAHYEVKPLLIEDCKTNYKAKAGTLRYNQEVAGTTITIDGVEYKIETDRDSRAKYIEKYVTMGDAANWKFNEGWKQLTKEQLYSIVSAIDIHVQVAFDEELRLNQVIDQCTTTEQLLAIEELNKSDNDNTNLEQPAEQNLMAINVNSQTVVYNDRTLRVSSGTTAGRPASPVVGTFWYNTTLAQLEVWNGTAWKAQLVSGGKPQTAYAWGPAGLGVLGDGTNIEKSSPVSVVGGFTDWVQISNGDSTTAGIRANGTAWAWGSGSNGKLGDGTTTSKSSPVSVVGGFTDWVQISVGIAHTVAIRANGTAWCWGDGGSGKLGDNTLVNKSSPVSVVGGFTDWVQISAGGDTFTSRGHTVAIRANGTAWCWGTNTTGELGDTTLVSKLSPVSVVGGFTDWVQISAGAEHTAAIRANGTAWAWGSGSNGRLGDGTTTSKLSPVSVVGGFTNWVQISAGREHTAAIRSNGTAWAWGLNSSGRLGDNTTLSRLSPVSVVGGFTDWVQIEAGNVHTAAIRANGTAWTWGYNAGGQLGDNTLVNKSSPVSVVGGFTDWVQISAGGHSAANGSTLAIRGQIILTYLKV